MNHELVRQLKDAGFPLVIFTPQEGVEHRATDGAVGEGTVIQTLTLSELIAACVLFNRLSYDAAHDSWRAAGSAFTGDRQSPEEPVAHLWLPLNNGGA
jgi:hypothetical protein